MRCRVAAAVVLARRARAENTLLAEGSLPCARAVAGVAGDVVHACSIVGTAVVEAFVYVICADSTSPPLGALTFEVLDLVVACRAIFTGICCAIVDVEDVGDVL